MREANEEVNAAADEEEMYLAQVMGAEKRAFIMNHVLGDND